MRICRGAEQKANNLVKIGCENIAGEKGQMKYIDVEEMRVVTNDKRVAEQIKSDTTLPARECLLNRKVQSTVMDGVKKLREETW